MACAALVVVKDDISWRLMRITCPGGISYTRADYTEEGSGGTFQTAEDYSRAMSGLTMYPEVTLPHSPCLLPRWPAAGMSTDQALAARTTAIAHAMSILPSCANAEAGHWLGPRCKDESR